MLKKTIIFLTIFILLGCIQQQSQSQPQAFSETVYFCPEDHCAEQLIERLDLAKESIDIAIYSFTLDEIADSLIRAKERGVSVRVLFDASQASGKYSEDERLTENAVPVKVYDKSSGIMHNKFAVIDSKLVGTGSFNYSQNANKFNDENLIFLDLPSTVQSYKLEFEELWDSS